MTDLQTQSTTEQNPALRQGASDNDLVLPLIGWGTYVFGWGLVGLVIAYVARKDAATWLRGHYTYMIRTFWIGVAYLLLALVLAGLFLLSSLVIHTAGFVLSGIAIWGLSVLTAIWFIVRCIKGIVLLVRRQASDNPQTWLV